MNNQLEFNFEHYLATLMGAMEMDQASPEVREKVTLELSRQLGYRLMNTLALNFADEDWAFVAKLDKLDNLSNLLSEVIEQNPRIKEVVVAELDKFFNEMLETYDRLKS
jgi:pheromone shutdown protein TraB